MIETYETVFLCGAEARPGKQFLRHITTANPEYTIVAVVPGQGNFMASSFNVFDALIRLRIVLERFGCRVRCQGARVDAWATRLARDMGGGMKVYITQPGQPPQRSQLVPTLAQTDRDVVTVAEQLAFHCKWIEQWQLELKMSNPDKPIPAEALETAKIYPGGYVYQIDGAFGPDENVPPEAIIGAWKVDDNGNIVDDFIPNPNYKPRSFSPEQ